MLNNAPDILMTNYKMLDYLLVRPKDALLWQDNEPETLKYIAVDELHTFDGAQGTDLACLLRRLKRRLGIYDGYLCCVGTSATMGSKENNGNILNYAEEIFGEPFDKDAIITEDRLSAQEFFAGAEVTEFTLPTVEQAIELEKLSEEDEPSAYLQSAVKDWLPNFSFDVLDDEGRIQLGYELMHHSFMQSVVNLTGGTYYQVSKIAEDLAVHYPDLKTLPDADVVINSLFALISHARTGKVGKLRPFLNVQVQLWMRELRRLVAKVDSDEITYEIAHDLNKQQAKQYLPVVNKERVFITDDVMQMRCDKCGSVYAVAAENAELWIGAPCKRTTCGGFLEEYESGEINYYGRLYSAGDLVRINAREHTGLLERPDREQLEIDFKRSKDTQEIWDPNVLSCTPTLEMGIDIGDLSTVILCSMPPAQSQFLLYVAMTRAQKGVYITSYGRPSEFLG